MPKPRILILTPYAGRTGSEMMIGYLLKRFNRERFDIALCALKDGELLRDLPADVPAFVAPHRFTLWQKVLNKAGKNPIFRYLRQVQKTFQADIWYFNTLVPSFLLPLAKELGVRVVTHFHELPMEYVALKRQPFADTLRQSDLLIGCSDIVCRRIAEAGGQRIKLCHSLIDLSLIQVNESRAAALRRQLELADDEFLWIMSGQTTYRKGFDLLPEFAERLRGSRARILWLGQVLDDGLVEYTLQRLGQTDGIRVDIAGAQREDYYTYLSMADGFLLTSREDPFPLVMIEAAALGKPVVSFPSGGVAEFLTEGMGAAVDSWNVRDVVAMMRQYMEQLRVSDPEKSRKRAQEFDVERIIPRWEEIMLEV